MNHSSKSADQHTQLLPDETESLLELISEEWFDLEIPDNGEPESKKILKTIDLFCLEFPDTELYPSFYTSEYLPRIPADFINHSPTPESPPPRNRQFAIS